MHAWIQSCTKKNSGDRVDTTLQRFLVSLPASRDLFICAKDLFVAARTMRCSHASAIGGATEGSALLVSLRVTTTTATAGRRPAHHTCLVSRISMASTYSSLRQRLALRSASARLPAHSARL